MDNLKQLFKNDKVKKISIILVLFFIIVIVLSIILMNTRQKMVSEEADHYPDESINDPGVSFKNRYLLDYTIGRIHDSEILDNIEEFVMQEVSSAPRKNTPIEGERDNLIQGTIEEDGFKKLQSTPYYVYFFNFNTSDGRSYKIYVREDINFGAEYVATAIDRTDTKADADIIYINTNNIDTYEAELINWAKSLGLSNLKSSVKSLAQDR